MRRLNERAPHRQAAATITANGTAISQSYVYDNLNRLALALENPTSTSNAQSPVWQGVTGTSWCQQYGYDAYGNNTMTSVNLGGFCAPSGFDPATNRYPRNGKKTGFATAEWVTRHRVIGAG